AEEFLEQQSKLNPSDLYIIDLNLGGMTGDRLCMHLKNAADTTGCRVLLISANPEIQQLATESGADGFIFKPFSQKELVSRIQLLHSPKPNAR
ncbi:MAG TPA: response regulator, partial [Chryseosolibacter sp.]|nr:response regulator [Chryseosolibacter sp.]